MNFDWKTYAFADYSPTDVVKLVPGKTYVSVSTSNIIYPNARWVVTFHNIILIDAGSPNDCIIVTIKSSTASGFDETKEELGPLAFNTKDRAFYDYNLLDVEKYTTNYNKTLLPPDVTSHIASFLISTEATS
jgi:hypothetical protein